MSLKQKQAESALLKFNKSYWDESLMPVSFYNALREFGIEIGKSVMVNLIPDGDNTYVGGIIRQDGSLFEFDLDLVEPENNTWEEVPNKSNKSSKLPQHTKTRPWDDIVLANELFSKISTNTE